jgi:hypothetical protein
MSEVLAGCRYQVPGSKYNKEFAGRRQQQERILLQSPPEQPSHYERPGRDCRDRRADVDHIKTSICASVQASEHYTHIAYEVGPPIGMIGLPSTACGSMRFGPLIQTE